MRLISKLFACAALTLVLISPAQAEKLTIAAAGNPLAKNFANYTASEPARVIMRRYGFALPGEAGK